MRGDRPRPKSESSGDQRGAFRRVPVQAAGGKLEVVFDFDLADLAADLGIAALSRHTYWWCSSSWSD